jgi:hypothetical protein
VIKDEAQVGAAVGFRDGEVIEVVGTEFDGRYLCIVVVEQYDGVGGVEVEKDNRSVLVRGDAVTELVDCVDVDCLSSVHKVVV